MVKRASPGIGHNSMLPDHADVRTALAIKMVFEGEKKKLREREKRANSRIESFGVNANDIKFLQGLDGKTGEEVVELFKRNWHLIGAVHQDKHEQLDIFAAKPEAPAVRAAYYTLGLLKGLKNEDPDIPPAVTGDSRQQYTDGHNEGMARYAAAWELIGKADRNEPIDGTGKTPSPAATAKAAAAAETAAKVGNQAAKDFAKDEGDDPLVVGGHTYPTIRQAIAARTRLAAGPKVVDLAATPEAKEAGAPEIQGEPLNLTDEEREKLGKLEPVPEDQEPILVEGVADAPRPLKPDFDDWSEDHAEWTGVQTMEIRRWLESLQDVPMTTHAGVCAYWRLLKAEGETARILPAPQEAELPDQEAIDAGVRKLAEAGFVPPKGGRRTRNLAKD